jgi:hypothetical protein
MCWNIDACDSSGVVTGKPSYNEHSAAAGDLPPVAVNAMVRRGFQKRVATQVLLTNVVPCVLCLYYAADAPSLRLRLSRLLCAVLCASLLALCGLANAGGRLPLRWQPRPESVMAHLVRLEVRARSAVLHVQQFIRPFRLLSTASVPTQVLTYFAFNAAGFLEFHAPASVSCPGANCSAKPTKLAY